MKDRFYLKLFISFILGGNISFLSMILIAVSGAKFCPAANALFLIQFHIFCSLCVSTKCNRQIMSPKDVFILIPGTGKYTALHAKETLGYY